MDTFLKAFQSSMATKSKCIDQGFSDLVEMGNKLTECYKSGDKLLLCGNGGSAADAQHLAAEMLVRLRPLVNRKALPAITLAQDTSTITACGNDYTFEDLFARTLEALGSPGDCLLAITTSGNSENVFRALKVAKEKGLHTFGFLGAGGGKCLSLCDYAFVVPSDNTANIQEAHIVAGHALMTYVEDSLVSDHLLCK